MAVRTVGDYLARVIPEHSSKPKFMAVLAAYLAPYVDAQAALASLVDDFDIDLAEGLQLDVLGLLIGVGRNLPIPVAPVSFALDHTTRGLDRGLLIQDGYAQATMLTGLDDYTYRRLLKARIEANNSDGSVSSILDTLRTFFAAEGLTVWMQDYAFALTPGRGIANPDMHFQIVIVGAQIPAILDLVILDQNLLPIKPTGISMDLLVSASSGPLFGLDRNDDLIGGLDSGSLACTPAQAIAILNDGG